MHNGLRVLHKGKIIGTGFEDGRRALEPFMESAQCQNAMPYGWFGVAQLQNLLAPQVRVKEFGPLGQGVRLEIVEGSVFCHLW